MTKIFMAALLFLTANNTLADVKNKEKAKFDLISSLEVLVNIDECKKGIKANGNSTVLPRACNSLPYLAKYFFDPKKDRAALDSYLNNEESKVSNSALRIIETYGITKLGKMILSPKCVKNKDPVDLDVYINKVRGLPVANEAEEANPANQLEKDFENKAKNHSKNGLETMPLPNAEPRNPAAAKTAKKVESTEPKSQIELEFQFETEE